MDCVRVPFRGYMGKTKDLSAFERGMAVGCLMLFCVVCVPMTSRIAQYTSDLTMEEVDTSFPLALKIWSDAASLKFIKVNHDKADIVLSFARKSILTLNHSWKLLSFDGPTGVLAHAFNPRECMGRDVHFDEDEIWTMGHRKLGRATSGHSLGTPVRKQDPPNCPKKCDPNFSVDAVAVFGKEIVFFKNKDDLFPSRYMWLRTTWMTYWNRLREAPSSTYLPSINSPVGAAYDIPAKGVAYVFTGPKYWLLRGKACHLVFNNETFVRKQLHISNPSFISSMLIFYTMYRYDEHRRRMDPGFPRNIQTDWPGIGTRVDAAFELQGTTIYLFSGTKEYNNDYRQNRVLSRFLANAWLGC
uniref:Matrix metallopeptidase 20a (enamelysin) n=1 Tax=Hucho hucho TaxID=62062 RepID=A0A4W5RX87_9TELE